MKDEAVVRAGSVARGSAKHVRYACKAGRSSVQGMQHAGRARAEKWRVMKCHVFPAPRKKVRREGEGWCGREREEMEQEEEGGVVGWQAGYREATHAAFYVRCASMSIPVLNQTETTIIITMPCKQDAQNHKRTKCGAAGQAEKGR